MLCRAEQRWLVLIAKLDSTQSLAIFAHQFTELLSVLKRPVQILFPFLCNHGEKVFIRGRFIGIGVTGITGLTLLLIHIVQ